MSGNNPAAILLGGFGNTVSVARALASQGVPVHALGNSTWDAVRHSRGCLDYFRGEGDDVQKAWFDYLTKNCSRLRGAVLLPCGDDGVELVARRRGDLVELGYRAVEANDDILLAMLDKRRTYELAGEAGVPVPRTVTLSGQEDSMAALMELGFPCAVKPIHSHVFARSAHGRKAFVLEGPKHARDTLDRLAATEGEFLATEIVEGLPERLMSYYTYIDELGRPLFHLTKRKLRQFPVDFGTETYGVMHWDAEVAEMGYRFLNGVALRGLAVVEFKRDARDEKLKLMECNARFTGSHELIRAAGINLALLAYNRVLGRPDPPLDSYRDGVRLWYPIVDVHAFLSLRRTGQLNAREWLMSLVRPQHFPVFRLLDPMPTIVDAAKRSFLTLRRIAATGPAPDTSPSSSKAQPCEAGDATRAA